MGLTATLAVSLLCYQEKSGSLPSDDAGSDTTLEAETDTPQDTDSDLYFYFEDEVQPDSDYDLSPDLGDDTENEIEPECNSPFIYLKNKQFRLGNEPFFPLSVNYIFDIRYQSEPTPSYYIAPHHCFCDDECCSDATACRSAIQKQLTQIKSMGLNSLRIVGLAVIPEDGTVVLHCGWQRPDWLDYCPKEAHLTMSPTDPIGLQLIEEAISLVREAGFKAVFLAGHGALDVEGVKDQYAQYLTALATHFADEPTIFAYDLTNEPIYEFSQKEIDKLAAHAIGRAWYDAVRAGTTKQMVTMGLAEIGTVRYWDPGVLPLDFNSFHIYVGTEWNNEQQNFLYTYYNWLNRETRPNLVGETGMSVYEGGATEAEQQSFAQFSLDTAWACGQLGLQWWLYRDTVWSPTDHLGLVRRDGTLRPSAEPFSAFTPIYPRPICPQAPYDGSESFGGFHTTGRLIREDGTPVENGYIRGHKYISGGWDWTISKADGTFDLMSTGPFNKVEATASGLSLEKLITWFGIRLSLGDITLKTLPLSMEVSTPSSCPE